MIHDFIEISPTLIWNSRTIRVHEDVACEISLLPGQSVPFWFSPPSVQSLQTNVESLEEKAWTASTAIFFRTAANRFFAGAHVERSVAPLPRSFASGLELPVSSTHASFCGAPESCKTARAAHPSGRRSLLSLQPTSVGAVLDGLEVLSSEPRCFPRPFAFSRSGRDRLLVANHRHHTGQSTKAYTRLGFRPNSRHHLVGRRETLDLAALSFPSHQPAA